MPQQQHDDFTSWTVDEQIERLSDGAKQEKTPNFQLVLRLRRYYQRQTAERRNRSLERAWERIARIQEEASKLSPLADEREGAYEGGIQAMKTQTDRFPSTQENEPQRVQTPTRLRRLRTLMQTLVAVLVMGLLLSGFLFVFATHHPGAGGTEVKQPATAKPGPSVPHGIVVASTLNGTVYGLRPDNGTILWHYATGHAIGGGFASNFFVVQGQVVYFVWADQVYALNATNGVHLWQRHLEKPVSGYSSIIVDSGSVYISEQVIGGGALGHMYALRARDGGVLWYHAGPESLLTANNGIVYVERNNASGNEVVQALQGKSGQFLWSYTTPAISGVASSNTIYIFSGHVQIPADQGGNKEDKSLTALSVKNGQLLWSKPVIDDGTNPLVLDQNNIILGNVVGSRYHYCAYRSVDGSRAWCSRDEIAPVAANVTNYIVMNDTLYSSTSVSLSPSSLTPLIEARSTSGGLLLWSKSLSGEIGSGPVANGNGALYMTTGRTIYAISGSDGHILWQYSLSSSNFFMSIAAGSW
jgi:outer membrane protein assembly factor BamB